MELPLLLAINWQVKTMQKILIVDDEDNIIRLIEYNLKKAGFRTVSAKNGREALRLAQSKNLI